MPRTAVLAALSLLTLSACDRGCYWLPYTPEPAQDVRLEEGAWSFDLDQVEFAGNCGPEELEAEGLRLRGSIFYTRGDRLEIEIEGLMLVGEQDGRSIFAEGMEWYDVDYAEDVDPREDEEAPNQGEDDEENEACEDDDYRCAQPAEAPDMYVSMDGRIDSPADLLGELIIEQDYPGTHCVIQTRYTAHFEGELAQTSPGSAGPTTVSESEGNDAD